MNEKEEEEWRAQQRWDDWRRDIVIARERSRVNAERIEQVNHELHEELKGIRANMVTEAEFAPIRRLIWGLILAIILGVCSIVGVRVISPPPFSAPLVNQLSK